MGSGASISANNDEKREFQHNAIRLFKDTVTWSKQDGTTRTDDEILEYLTNDTRFDDIICQIPGKLIKTSNFDKEDDLRSASTLSPSFSDDLLSIETESSLGNPTYHTRYTEHFSDSSYHRLWLAPEEADDLFYHLKQVGEQKRAISGPRDTTKMKYPLWTLYYGMKRNLDGALALDRWGSYHESWIRVEEPSREIEACCNKLRHSLGLHENSVNSIVVNYYFDGDTTYIPAHRDTVSCLEDGSSVICLSLGASRDFVLTDNSNCGEYIKDKMKIKHEWRVKHGDLFVLGPETNEKYCHAVPMEPALENMRISVIFRTISKSFVNLNGPYRSVKYASGTMKEFNAICITTSGFNDYGTEEHIVDLIQERENKRKILTEKKNKQSDKNITKLNNDYQSSSSGGIVKLLTVEKSSKYYMGEGMTVPNTN